MPFSVEVEIRQSPIEGFGIFSLQPIKKGDVIWTIFEKENSIPIKNRPHPQKNKIWSKQQVLEMSAEQISYLLNYGYPNPKFDKIIELNDGSKYQNHSDSPNVGGQYSKQIQQDQAYALRDIEKGQQLTQDYRSFKTQQMSWLIQLQKKYCPQSWCLKNLYPDV